MKPFTLLFVCTGNLCRSPMAEGIMKELLVDEAAEKHIVLPVTVASAGVHAEPGLPASRFAVETAAAQGIDLTFHRSRLLTAEIARKVDLILAMERAHVEFIAASWPDVSAVYELKRYGRPPEAAHADLDVADPYGYGIDVYRRVFDELKEEVGRISRIVFPAIAARFGAV